MQLNTGHQTTQQLLLSLENCTHLGARFTSRTGQDDFFPYADVLQRARRAAAFYQKEGIQPGDRVAILLPTGIEFFDAFLGAILAGAIPAALYPPFRLGKLEEYFERTRQMLRRIEARMVVTDDQAGKLLGRAVTDVRSVKRAIQARELTSGTGWRPVEAIPDEPVFLQFSSGSTREPKAVVVTHRNLLCNLEMMASSLRKIPDMDPVAGGVCWLPLYHDMGLVGCLFNGLHYPGTVTYLRPDDFVVRPSLWLQTLSRTRAQVSPAPHFAYRLCVSKIKNSEMDGVDLSHWRMALNGAEPIDTEGLQAFTRRFERWGFRPEAMTPVYGLAEAGLAVSFGTPLEPPRIVGFDRDELSAHGRVVPNGTKMLAAVGSPLPGLTVTIRGEDGNSAPPDRVGRITVHGPSITPGYYNDPGLTSEMLRNGWLDTGDLGFLHGGELFIVGRAKDLIIIRGRNYAPQEIEELVWDLPGVREGCVVAVSHLLENQGEQLIIFAEKDKKHPVPEEELVTAIRDRVIAALPMSPYLVQMLDPGTLPRTSSGKLRRADALRLYLDNKLVPPGSVTSLKLFLELGKSQLAWGRFRVGSWSQEK